MRWSWLGGVGALALGTWMHPSGARALERYEASIPCAARDAGGASCITCHTTADATCSTPPCLNPFGLAFEASPVWAPALAAQDADGDGYTNGEELGDPEGAWGMGDAPPAACGCVSRPGSPAFTPGGVDGDGDGVCCRGADANGDGDCLDPGENDGAFDCDDGDALSSSAAMEVCTNPADNDCDGLLPAVDPECPCSGEIDCDDGDPCTEDTCPGICEHTPIAGCGVDAGLEGDAGGGDAGGSDAGGSDAGGSDAGVDTGAGPDGGGRADAGTTTPPDAGCGCRVGVGPGPARWLGLLVLGALLLRRHARGRAP